MTHLTTDEISELHDLALARLDEFDSVAVHLPKLLPAYVRIVIEVYEEWRAGQIIAVPDAPQPMTLPGCACHGAERYRDAKDARKGGGT